MKSPINTKTTMIRMKPSKAMKLEEDKLARVTSTQGRFSQKTVSISIFFKQGKNTKIGKTRNRCFLEQKAYRVDRIGAERNSRILYYLNRSFVSEGRMLILEDVKVLLAHAKKVVSVSEFLYR